MGLFKRGATVKFELSQQEVEELASISAMCSHEDDVLQVASRYPDSWALHYHIVPMLLQSGNTDHAYHIAQRCLTLRRDDPRSRFALMLVYQQLSLAVLADAQHSVDAMRHAMGRNKPVDLGAGETRRIVDQLGLDIDKIIDEQRQVIGYLLQLKVDRSFRRQLERASSLNDLARDWRSGAVQSRTLNRGA